MIIVRLWGGLGNQMFQYAFGYAFAKNNQTELLLDTRFYTDSFLKANPHFSKQKAHILGFPIEYREQVNLHNEYRAINFLQKRLVSRIIRIPKKFAVTVEDGIRYYKETRLKVYPELISLKDENVYFDGYWQSEQYFQKYKDELVTQFTICNDNIKAEIEKYDVSSENAISVHLRLGDYAAKKKILSQYNYVISPEFYLMAMDKLRSRIDNPRFLVFSNNVTKAKEILGNKYDYTIINEDRHLSDIEEFMVMSKCRHHIISNSTFSWWAAWINDKGYTIAPDVFFGNEAIIPEKWEKVRF